MVNEFMKHLKERSAVITLFAMGYSEFPHSFVKSMTRVSRSRAALLVKHQKIARENLQFAFGRKERAGRSINWRMNVL